MLLRPLAGALEGQYGWVEQTLAELHEGVHWEGLVEAVAVVQKRVGSLEYHAQEAESARAVRDMGVDASMQAVVVRCERRTAVSAREVLDNVAAFEGAVSKRLGALDMAVRDVARAVGEAESGLGERVQAVESQAEVEIANLEAGTRLALEALQSHVDSVQESLDSTEVSLSAELAVMHAGQARQSSPQVHSAALAGKIGPGHSPARVKHTCESSFSRARRRSFFVCLTAATQRAAAERLAFHSRKKHKHAVGGRYRGIDSTLVPWQPRRQVLSRV